MTYLDQVQSLGCIACYLDGVYSPAEIHHPLDGGRRRGNDIVLPLCVPHHRGGGDGTRDPRDVSRHPYKKRFESRYGTEDELLEIVARRVRDRYGE